MYEDLRPLLFSIAYRMVNVQTVRAVSNPDKLRHLDPKTEASTK